MGRTRKFRHVDLILLVFHGDPDCVQAKVNERLRMYPGSTVEDVTESSLMAGLMRAFHDHTTLAYFLACSQWTPRMETVINLNSNRVIEWYYC